MGRLVCARAPHRTRSSASSRLLFNPVLKEKLRGDQKSSGLKLIRIKITSQRGRGLHSCTAVWFPARRSDMHLLRCPLFVALALLVLSQRVSARPSDERGEESARRRDTLLARITQSTSEKKHALEREDAHRHGLKTENGEPVLVIYPRDLRKKEKFLKHLTGPLYFSPKCRKHVYRLYHNTRDCTIPAYYKRCARLLTRLAGSPRCLES